MSDPAPCCRDLGIGILSPSPFKEEIVLGYYDGPTDGLIRCHSCRREYHFSMLDSRDLSADDDTRIFLLSPVPAGSMVHFTSEMSAYHEPSQPIWVPLWSFPTEEDRDKMNRIVDGIIDQKTEAEWVVATSSWLTSEILAARSFEKVLTNGDEDWFVTLGLLQAVVED